MGRINKWPINKKIVILILLAFLLIAAPSQAFGAAGTKQPDWLTPWSTQPVVTNVETIEPDYLNPFTADRPEWDPYAPFVSKQLLIERVDPIASGLTIKDELRIPNILYVQLGNMLTTRASVILGDPIILWVYISTPGSVVLYDNGKAVYSTAVSLPGWYRITGAYADILAPHLYLVRAGWLITNNVSVLVDPGRYPTTYSLVGRVVDHNGLGLPGAKVRIFGEGGSSFIVTTDLLGYYGINLPSGIYLISAELPGYTFTTATAKVWLGTLSAAPTIIGIPVGSMTNIQGKVATVTQ